MDKEKDYLKPEYYENRELSWLKFNYRVLNEARDKNIPLLERLKFVSITSSNLDEFFMVRVASLKDMVHAGYKKTDIAGMTAKEQLEAINKDTRALVEMQYSTYNRSLVPLLHNHGIEIISAYEELDEVQGEYVDRYFEETVYPVLTPMAVDASRPFPLIRNKSLNIAALLNKKGDRKEELEFATVQVPSVLSRIVQIPSQDEGSKTFILLEQIIERNIHRLFLNYHVVCAWPYRIMRNADLTIDEDEAEDLLQEIQKQLKKRQWGEVIRLEVEDKMDKRLLGILKEDLHIAQEDIFKKDLAMYTFRERCEEVPDLPLNDGTSKIFLNMTSHNGRPELISLLQYMKETTLDNSNITVQDDRILDLDRIVQDVKQSEEWEAVKMNILEIGIEQGMQKGEDRLAELLQFLKNAGRDEDADRAIFDVQYREQLYQEYETRSCTRR